MEEEYSNEIRDWNGPSPKDGMDSLGLVTLFGRECSAIDVLGIAMISFPDSTVPHKALKDAFRRAWQGGDDVLADNSAETDDESDDSAADHDDDCDSTDRNIDYEMAGEFSHMFREGGGLGRITYHPTMVTKTQPP